MLEKVHDVSTKVTVHMVSRIQCEVIKPFCLVGIYRTQQISKQLKTVSCLGAFIANICLGKGAGTDKESGRGLQREIALIWLPRNDEFQGKMGKNMN